MIHSQRTAEIDIMISICHCRRPQFMSNVINKCECEIYQCLQKYIKRVVGKRYFSWANLCTKMFVDKLSELALSIIILQNLDSQVCFPKYQVPGSQKFTSNLHEISHLICVITSGSCLEKSSNFKHCFGHDIEATVEPGHRVKSLQFRHFENTVRLICVMQLQCYNGS